MAQRVERIAVGQTHPNWNACRVLCSLSRKLGNCASYLLRHRIFDKKTAFTRKELDTELRTQYPVDYRNMPSAASAQRQGQVIAKEFKSYTKAMAEYKKNPKKFKEQPRLPGYKNRYRAFYVGRNGYQIIDHVLSITGGDKVGFRPMRIICCENQIFNAKEEDAVVGDLRIIPRGSYFIIELTYRKDKRDKQTDAPKVKLNPVHTLIIDLGVGNVASIVTTRPGLRSLLIKGGVLKSINQFYNKRAAELRSKGHRKHLLLIGFKRHKQIWDLLHKISRLIINLCVANDLGKLIVGYRKGWKQNSNMGKRNNQNFVMLPHGVFVEMLRYKAEEFGIQVIVREESYTSKASAIDLDPIPTYGAEVIPEFSGKRIERGLYRSKSGRLINADIQAAINIGRKELGNEWFSKLLGSHEGIMDTPVVIRNLHQQINPRTLLETGVRSRETPCVSVG